MAVIDPRSHCFLAEWYQPSPARGDVDGIIAAFDEAIAHTGATVRLLVALAAPNDEVVYVVFAADSISAVAALCEVIDWPADRITDGIFTRIPCLGS